MKRFLIAMVVLLIAGLAGMPMSGCGGGGAPGSEASSDGASGEGGGEEGVVAIMALDPNAAFDLTSALAATVALHALGGIADPFPADPASTSLSKGVLDSSIVCARDIAQSIACPEGGTLDTATGCLPLEDAIDNDAMIASSVLTFSQCSVLPGLTLDGVLGLSLIITLDDGSPLEALKIEVAAKGTGFKVIADPETEILRMEYTVSMGAAGVIVTPVWARVFAYGYDMPCEPQETGGHT